MKKEKLCAIVPTHNRKELLEKLLCSIYEQQLCAIEIIVVVIVDGSNDGTLEMLKIKFPQAIMIHGDGDWWYTKCINEGIKYAQQISADFVLTLNDDLVLEYNYCRKLIDSYNTVKKLSIIGSASITSEQPNRITFSGIKRINKLTLKEFTYLKKYSIVNLNSLHGIYPSVNLSGRGILIPTLVFSEIGLFDQRFIQYGSDTDFSYRAYKRGIGVYVSYDARVFENVKTTSQGYAFNSKSFFAFIKQKFDKHSSNSIIKNYRFFKKHGIRQLLLFYLLYDLFASIFVYINHRNKLVK